MAIQQLANISGLIYDNGSLKLNNGNFLYVDIIGNKYYAYLEEIEDDNSSTINLYIECPHLNNNFYHKKIILDSIEIDTIFAKRYYIAKNTTLDDISNLIICENSSGQISFANEGIEFSEYTSYYEGLKPTDNSLSDLSYNCYIFNRFETSSIDNYETLSFVEINESISINNPLNYTNDFVFNVSYDDGYVCSFTSNPISSIDNTITDLCLTHNSNVSSYTKQDVNDASLSEIVNSHGDFTSFYDLVTFIKGIEISFNRVSSKLLFIDPVISIVTNVPKIVSLTLTGLPNDEEISEDNLTITPIDGVTIECTNISSIENDKVIFTLSILASTDLDQNGESFSCSYQISNEEGVRTCSSKLLTSHTQKYNIEKDTNLGNITYTITNNEEENEEDVSPSVYEDEVITITNNDIVSMTVEGFATIVGPIRVIDTSYDDVNYTTTFVFTCLNVSDTSTINKIILSERPFEVLVEKYVRSTLYNRTTLVITNDSDGLESIIDDIPRSTASVEYGSLTNTDTLTRLPFAFSLDKDSNIIKVTYTPQTIDVLYNETKIGEAYLTDIDVIRHTRNLFCNVNDLSINGYALLSASSDGLLRFDVNDIVDNCIDITSSKIPFFKVKDALKDFLSVENGNLIAKDNNFYYINYDLFSPSEGSLSSAVATSENDYISFENGIVSQKRCCVKESYEDPLIFTTPGNFISTISNDDLDGKDIIFENNDSYFVGKIYAYKHSIIDNETEVMSYVVDKKYRVSKKIDIELKSHVPTTGNTRVSFNINPGINGLIISLTPLNGHTYDKYFSLAGKTAKKINGLSECTLNGYSLNCRFEEGQVVSNIEAILMPLLNK